ncbi:MAG: NlpC/P60 family protein [Phaeospirillum sp.]|nr:NlpC/P60 family protein [Phaeospirillum sp.]
MNRECQSPVGAPHWATALIGLPWSVHGSGPDLFNCWEFVRMVQSRHFGRTLAEIANPEDILGLGRTFRDHPERRRWAKVEHPAEGDCVLLRQSRHPIHVGIWLDVDGGGVLHCSRESGVVFQRPDALRLNGLAIEGFYRFIGNPA